MGIFWCTGTSCRHTHTHTHTLLLPCLVLSCVVQHALCIHDHHNYTICHNNHTSPKGRGFCGVQVYRALGTEATIELEIAESLLQPGPGALYRARAMCVISAINLAKI
uniref:Putative secreted protein n=1 Tax=Anopheles darlingi TaxID=43151 RepID=A0A2M4D678_ANODA